MLLLKNRKFEVYIYTSGGSRCKEEAIYVFHLQQGSSRHPPDLSIGIYPSCIKKPSHPPFPPCLSQCNPSGRHSACVRCLLHVFSSVLKPVLYPFSRHAPGLFFQNFSHLFIISFLLVLLRYAYDIQLCSFSTHSYCPAATPTPRQICLFSAARCKSFSSL
jgi:hypothetical protein